MVSRYSCISVAIKIHLGLQIRTLRDTVPMVGKEFFKWAIFSTYYKYSKCKWAIYWYSKWNPVSLVGHFQLQLAYWQAAHGPCLSLSLGFGSHVHMSFFDHMCFLPYEPQAICVCVLTCFKKRNLAIMIISLMRINLFVIVLLFFLA